LHELLSGLLAKDKIDQLGFFDSAKAAALIDEAFEKGKPQAMRLALVIAQWVVLAERFGIKKAERPW
jgi:asparagine synthase (glutamine-hydrolysing)